MATQTGLRGFALLSKEERARIARKGGIAAHKLGVAHEFAPGQEARDAGAKGGRAGGRPGRGKKAYAGGSEEDGTGGMAGDERLDDE